MPELGVRSALYQMALLFGALFMSQAVLARPLVVLAYGDSLTAGYQLPPGQGFAPQLEKALKAKGRDVTVVGAGVSGAEGRADHKAGSLLFSLDQYSRGRMPHYTGQSSVITGAAVHSGPCAALWMHGLHAAACTAWHGMNRSSPPRPNPTCLQASRPRTPTTWVPQSRGRRSRCAPCRA